MNERIPKSEYEVSYLHLVFFILIFILLLLISFFIGYKTGEKGKCKKVESSLVKAKSKRIKTVSSEKKISMIMGKKQAKVENPVIQLGEGEAPKVEVKRNVVKKETKVKKAKNKVTPKKSKKKLYRSGYYVQIAAVKDLRSAEKEAKKFRKHFKVVIFTPSKAEKRKFYRLRTGPFRTKAQAKSFLLKIKSRYKIKGFIVKID